MKRGAPAWWNAVPKQMHPLLRRMMLGGYERVVRAVAASARKGAIRLLHQDGSGAVVLASTPTGWTLVTDAGVPLVTEDAIIVPRAARADGAPIPRRVISLRMPEELVSFLDGYGGMSIADAARSIIAAAKASEQLRPRLAE